MRKGERKLKEQRASKQKEEGSEVASDQSVPSSKSFWRRCLEFISESGEYQILSRSSRSRLLIPAFVMILALFLAPPPREYGTLSIFDKVSKAGDALRLTVTNQFREFADFNVSSFETFFSLMREDKGATIRPGLLARNEGIRKKYPIIMLPGATTTGLEIWQGKPCAKAYFKQRLWGTMSMFSSLASMDAACFLEHISLNLTTGLDPDGIKVRPAQGLDNVEYLIPGFWVWAKIIESLADIGYDSDDLIAHPYDWRLSPAKLEIRDGLLTRMKHSFEASFEMHKKPACVLSHSYGDSLVRYFMSWVESSKGGKGGKGWVDKYMHRYINIGGPILGLPKIISGLVSGDTSDSIWLPDFAPFLTDHSILSRSGRSHWFRSMSSGSCMMPQGGQTIWGSRNNAPDDVYVNKNTSYSYGTYMCITGDSIKTDKQKTDDRKCVQMTMTEAINIMFARIGKELRLNYDIDEVHEAYSSPVLTKAKESSPKIWGHSLLDPLPYAPNLQMYCLYGVGKPTERSYVFKYENSSDTLQIDKLVTIPDMEIDHGVQFADGDGTVPLVSLGYMCVEGWKKKHLNPSNIDVITKEYMDEPATLSFRGGPRAADHVNILGNSEMIYDLLKIASGLDVEGRIHSNIVEISKKVNF